MVRTLNGAIATVSQDTTRIQRSYRQLCAEYLARDKALAELTAMVEGYGSSPEATRPYSPSPGTTRTQPIIQADVMDGEGNLRAADIGITWEGGETFLHGVKVVGSPFPQPVGSRPIGTTPYSQVDETKRRDTSTTTRPATLRTPNQDDYVRRTTLEVRQGYRPAAPIQTGPSTGRRGFVISTQWQTFMDGTKTSKHYSWYHTSTRLRWMRLKS